MYVLSWPDRHIKTDTHTHTRERERETDIHTYRHTHRDIHAYVHTYMYAQCVCVCHTFFIWFSLVWRWAQHLICRFSRRMLTFVGACWGLHLIGAPKGGCFDQGLFSKMVFMVSVVSWFLEILEFIVLNGLCFQNFILWVHGFRGWSVKKRATPFLNNPLPALWFEPLSSGKNWFVTFNLSLQGRPNP